MHHIVTTKLHKMRIPRVTDANQVSLVWDSHQSDRRRTEEGMVEADSVCNFHRHFQLRVPCGDDFVELVPALIFEATRLNPEKQHIPQSLADGEDMSYLHRLMWSVRRGLRGNYFFSPHTPPDLQQKIKAEGYRSVSTDPCVSTAVNDEPSDH